MDKTNITFKKVTLAFSIFYFIFSATLGIYYSITSTLYFTLVAFSAPLFLLIPKIFEFVFALNTNYILHFTTHIYSFTLYVLGVVLEGYHRLKYFDKFCHTLTGIIFCIFGCIVFSILKPINHFIEKEDFPLVSFFSICFTMFIASMWELIEYTISLILKNDPQRVILTGVTDTMQDIMVCLIGSILVLPSIYAYCKNGKTNFSMKFYESFNKISFKRRPS